MSYYQTAKHLSGLTKRNAEILHAIKRARQRYDLVLSVADIEQISKIIRTQATERVKAISNARALHRLSYKQKTILVVYDKKRHTVITFLPNTQGENHV